MITLRDTLEIMIIVCLTITLIFMFVSFDNKMLDNHRLFYLVVKVMIVGLYFGFALFILMILMVFGGIS